MTFLWQFNLILKKVLEYRTIGVGMPYNEFDRYIKENPLLSTCDSDLGLKLGKALNFFYSNENNIIHLTEFGEYYLSHSDQDSLIKITDLQMKLIEEFMLNNWIFEDLEKYAIKKEDRFLIYKLHSSKYCAVLISLLKTLNLLSGSMEDDFFELSTNLNHYWEVNFQIPENLVKFHPEILDYEDYWKKILQGKKFTEDDLEKILKKQKIIGTLGENIAFRLEKQEVNKFPDPNLINRVRLIARDYVDKGYDILSVNKDGSSKYIEVKTTNSLNTRFFLSRNEYSTSIKFNEDYWIYFVNLKNNTLKKFNNVHYLVENGILPLKPTLYEVEVPFESFRHETMKFSDIEREDDNYENDDLK